MNSYASIKFDAQSHQFLCEGEWTLSHIIQLKSQIQKIAVKHPENVSINGKNISQLDSAGAWLLITFINTFKTTATFEHFSEPQQKLLTLIREHTVTLSDIPVPHHLTWLQTIGKDTLDKCGELYSYLAFVGKLTLETIKILPYPAQFRWKSCLSIVETTGFQALMIIALLSSMIGVVITYQMGLQLKTYGANIFIVDLLGLAVFREFGPLLTAIMVAGRSGSAFTAQIGTMKINQEIDALNTMGVSPATLLFLPRIVGLTITLPLLSMWADIFGVFGGMIMSKSMLDINWTDFLNRFQHVISLRSFLTGLGKAPVFALIIASIGCYEGSVVGNSADSIGKQTTKSVVLSIFFIIIADALFSVVFSKFHI